MQIRPYLIFKGECQEAIKLYERAFETKVSRIMRFSDLPQDPEKPMEIPESQKNWIVMATLPFGDTILSLSDTIGELNDQKSERTGIIVDCSIEQVKNAFTILSEEGEVGIPLQETFFSPCHGLVHDKFGVMWNFVGVAED
jgi:PhnB protein